MILLIYGFCAQRLYKRDALSIYKMSECNGAVAGILYSFKQWYKQNFGYFEAYKWEK